ncbi:Uncharacterised protein [Micrococcus luteus NCTC 2665]|uniref:ABC transporter permease n=1 Tax=Micrococcus luteus (strain ATCC 4698 / DSM 20030 / JCM 1464 / CCM 169 / CCUG 5858 / IAM 1056 / NBRC 3333 / NCIMB 9278 / NCTC 2665 / VKM Ac-2230) TaxID=465515 RepID=C5C804_MICLC|nr:hypothetical protein [Micrococcus luteus]ACS29606.1 Hypothetical protein Mlut_00340 [Micrococcus luteus NCTC 2665]AJO56851.1 hypothetical protein BF96_00195 [Micrococcus luteus]SQG48280.1 Uncharacterised protein [Micrococcus luteus NCTC 2665]
MMENEEMAQPAGSRWGQVAGVVALVAVALSLLVLSFVWPGARGEATGLSIAVTGDAELVDEFMAGAGEGLDEVVDLVRVDGRADAHEGILTREFIGGIVLAHDAPEVLTASANGQVPAAFMSELASGLQAMLDAQVYAGVTEGVRGAVEQGVDPATALAQTPEALPEITVTDVVPYSAGDPNGVGATVAGIPMTVGALLAGIVITFTLTGRWQRISAVLGLGVGGGLLLTLVLGTWLDVYPGSFGAMWLTLGLSLTATSGLFVGLHSALGRAGLGIAAAITLFAAMPWAAFAVPYAFLPAGLGYVGQWMIPGATGTLTRVVGYFPEASAAVSWWVLACWAAIGIALALISRRTQPTSHEAGTGGSR